MRLNLYLRGIDLLDIEFHAGSKGLYLDVNVFRPRDEGEDPPETRQVAGTAGADIERADGPVWSDDQPAVVRKVGF